MAATVLATGLRDDAQETQLSIREDHKRHKEDEVIRARCRAQGPVGHLLESLHMQAAAMDQKGMTLRHNQMPIDLFGLVYGFQVPIVPLLAGCRVHLVPIVFSLGHVAGLFRCQMTSSGQFTRLF